MSGSGINKEIQRHYDEMVLEDPEKLKEVPYEFKTYDMCLRVILLRPDLIKLVPITILTSQFEADLKKRKVEIPEKLRRYVGICKKIQKKRESLEISFMANPYIPEEIANISLSTLTSLISLPLLRDLNDLGVENLGQLFQLTPDDMNVFNWSGRHSRGRELAGVQRILRCKYLNEDPMIEEDNETARMDDIFSSMGLSARAVNSLLRSKKFPTAKNFFEIMRSEDAEYELFSVRDCGQITREEILEKANIIIQYHDKVNGMTPNKPRKDERANNIDFGIKRITAEEIMTSATKDILPQTHNDVSPEESKEQLKVTDQELSSDRNGILITEVKGEKNTNKEALLSSFEEMNINYHFERVLELLTSRMYENASLVDLRNELQRLGKMNDELNKAIDFVLKKIKEKEMNQVKGDVLE